MAHRLRVVSIGAGGVDQLTVEAVEALRSADFAIVARKRADDPLESLRREIVARHAPDLEVVPVDDPERDRRAATTTATDGYLQAVGDWHEARARAYEAELVAQWDAGRGDAVFLVWGDPAFYDSTIRIVDQLSTRDTLDFDWDVIAGISAFQVLAARHRLVLHGVGEPVTVTTARRLTDAVASGQRNIVVMLVADVALNGLEDWLVWWGANLGTASERLVAGRVHAVADRIDAARADARREAGWVMDVFYLKAP